MVEGHKIQEKVEIEVFLEIIKNLKRDDIGVRDHAIFRIKRAERKAFKDKLIDTILHENPVLVGIQRNGNYAVYYRCESDNLKMILDIQPKSIIIVTAYTVDTKQVPRI